MNITIKFILKPFVGIPQLLNVIGWGKKRASRHSFWADFTSALGWNSFWDLSTLITPFRDHWLTNELTDWLLILYSESF